MTPELDFYNLCRDVAVDLIGEANVYSYLPPAGAAYPFIYLGEQQHVETTWQNKSVIFPTLYQTVYIYDDKPDERGSMVDIATRFMAAIRQARQTEHYRYHIVNIDYRQRADTSTAVPLLQAIIDIQVKPH